MKVLFISKYKYPHIGGVEKHIEHVSDELSKKKYVIKKISGDDINYPRVKFLGLIYIWLWFLRNLKHVLNSDIVHIHDVFIWFLPFRFLFPFKKVFITFHGWEGIYPIPPWSKFNKWLAYQLTRGNISVGKYVGKYYKIQPNYVVYGGVDKLNSNEKIKKNKNSILFLGRLSKDTGLLEFLEYLKKNKKYKVKFVGDGPLKKLCLKYGEVVGNTFYTQSYLSKPEYCVPSGYLSYIEAKNYGCKILTFSNNVLKDDYWKEIKNLKKIPLWGDVADIYVKLWKK